jgi:hypothetical protein
MPLVECFISQTELMIFIQFKAQKDRLEILLPEIRFILM